MVRLWLPSEPPAGLFDGLGDVVEPTVYGSCPTATPGLQLAEFFVISGVDSPGVRDAFPCARSLRVVQSFSAGVEWIVPLVPPGVLLCNGSGVFDVPVAEWVMATLLATLRCLPESFANQTRGCWGHTDPSNLAGSTVLILGYGSIGRAVAARLEPFDVTLLRIALHARPGVSSVDEVEKLLGQADIVIVLLPLTALTRHLLDARALAAMRPGALLINAGRGAVVDTKALLERLHAGSIRAALDVTDPEPLDADHPLWRAPNVIITPHNAGDDRTAEGRAWRLVRSQLERYLAEQPLRHVVSNGY